MLLNYFLLTHTVQINFLLIPKYEMTKKPISNQSHKSYSENGRTRTSEYIRGGIHVFTCRIDHYLLLVVKGGQI
jgi:hypothetical protein